MVEDRHQVIMDRLSSSCRPISKQSVLTQCFFIVLLFGLQACQSSPSSNTAVPPVWYKQTEQRNNIIVALGVGASYELAYNDAVTKLSKTIKIDIKSNTKLTESRNRQGDNTAIDSKTEIKSDVRLSNVKEEAYQQVDQQHYIKLSYDNRPSFIQLAQKLRVIYSSEFQCLGYSGAKAIMESEFVDNLFRAAGKQNYASSCLTLPLALKYDQGFWTLSAGLAVQSIRENELRELLNWGDSSRAKLSLSVIDLENRQTTDKVKPGTDFLLKLIGQPKDTGYISLFNVYSNGAVCLISSAMAMEPLQVIPDFDKVGYYLTASSLVKNKADLDTYIAVHSRNKLGSQFTTQFDTQCEFNSTRYSVPELINLLEHPEVINHSTTYLQIMENKI